MSDRIRKINELLRFEISALISREIEFPNDSLVTVLQVETSQDLRHSNVYISVMPHSSAQEVLKKLYEARFHEILYKKLALKPLPQFHYKLDLTEERAKDIESLLDQIKKRE